MQVPPLCFALTGMTSNCSLLAQEGEASDGEGGLGEEERAGDPEEKAVIAGFEDVGEDSADEGKQKGQGPESRLAGNSRGDEDEEDGGDDERGGVAEVATAARRGVECKRSDGRDGDGGVGERGEEGSRGLEGNAERGGIAAEDVGEGVRIEGVGGEEDEKGSEHPGDEEGGEVGAAGFRDPCDEADGEG